MSVETKLIRKPIHRLEIQGRHLEALQLLLNNAPVHPIVYGNYMKELDELNDAVSGLHLRNPL